MLFHLENIMANMQLRIEDDLKAQTTLILAQMGLDPTTAVRMYFMEICRTYALPFQPKADPFYNRANIAYLEKALDDVRHGRNVSQHNLIRE